MYYRPLEHRHILWKCLVVLCKCVVSEPPFYFRSRHCANCTIALCWLWIWSVEQIHESPTLTRATIRQNQKKKGSSSYAGTLRHSSALLPVSLAMAKVHPAESAIYLLAVSCFIAVVIQCSCLSTCACYICMTHNCIHLTLLSWITRC